MSSSRSPGHNRIASVSSSSTIKRVGRRGVQFRHHSRIAAPSNTTMTNSDVDTLGDGLQEKARIVEVSSSDDDQSTESGDDEVSSLPFPGTSARKQENLPPWLKDATLKLFHDDDLQTTSSEAQKKVTTQCLPLLTGEDTQGLPLNSHGLPHLLRRKHVQFLHSSMDSLPAPYVVIDASRPWFFYWAMAGLSSLGEDVSQYRERLMKTVRPLQNPAGGFGGGHGQLSHCAATYATILALACVDGLDVVNRKAMWHWLGSVKQLDGGFRMAVGAEEDIRGAYCAMTILTLLNLPLTLPPDCTARVAGLETFTDGLGEWIRRCQTFEGGIAGAPSNEEHGAYAFCALACLSIMDAPHHSIPRYLNLPALISCLSSVQTTPEGGFAGRHNKLVDACYSHWIGGCWALIDAAITPPTSSAPSPARDLWNRAALVRYLLTCAQQKKGGMRDKPSTRPDGYHTCYSLAGLSAAQNRYRHHPDLHFDPQHEASPSQDHQHPSPAPERLQAAFQWTAHRASAAERQDARFDEEDAVAFVHPVFVIPMSAVEAAWRKFAREGFPEI